MARLAKALETLRDQVHTKWPSRNTSSDGWIASDAHHQQNPSSDHESDSRGIVHALDLTHDPAHGFDSYEFADFLLEHRDPRIKYVISNRRIGGDENYAKRNGKRAWTWARYNGENPHDQHVHISCNRENEDDARAWTMPGADFVAAGSGKSSWYSQFEGQYTWRDTGDKPGSNALGVPDSQQGFAMYDRTTLGTRRYVRAPNQVTLLLQQTDIGPHPSTGRAIDIAAAAAEHFGYSPRNFPTDGVFEWSVIIRDGKPSVQPSRGYSDSTKALQTLLGFSEAEQDGYFGADTMKALKWFQRRAGLDPNGMVGLETLVALRGAPSAQNDVLEAVVKAILPAVESRYLVFTQEQLDQLLKAAKGT